MNLHRLKTHAAIAHRQLRHPIRKLLSPHYRGVAVEEPISPHNLHLLIQDYPYVVDGLAIWSAIESWVTEYCSIYYTSDDEVSTDKELQAWWKELREIGHGNKRDHEPWWPKLSTMVELIRTCTTIIWIASTLHVVVNFGEYPYAGYIPNQPTISRRLMTEPRLHPNSNENAPRPVPSSVPNSTELDTALGTARYLRVIGRFSHMVSAQNNISRV
ncbi:hypothetical protein IEQ34_001104 [Dendrobium chrysotoxum]|uniref:Lipoxygenase domain-containing protein n=1 Tax=Dendrobium chrysotoxum TaxID=161865 RepID=A0AAV7HKE1_DENCH|nr:hypothetical protein IEQ34_001104 [Dendrobium chrysotoxum]